MCNGSHTHYFVEQSGSGPPLLLLHGFTGSCRSWDQIVPQLASHYRVICVDLPGHGRTPIPANLAAGSLEAVAADLANILVDLAASPAHVVGYSMGARLALGLAIRHPNAVQSLILESGSPGIQNEAERAARAASDEGLAARIEHNGIAAFVREWEQLALWHSQTQLPEATRQRQRTLRLANTAAGLAYSLRSMGTGVQPSFWQLLADLTPPTLLITGTLDTKFCQIAEAMMTHAPHIQHRLIADCGHTTHLEQPEVFAQSVLAWSV